MVESTKHPKKKKCPMPGKKKTIVRVADTVIAVEALVENTDATVAMIAATRIADTTDTMMIVNAGIATDPAPDRAAETTTDDVPTRALVVDRVAKTRSIRDVGALSAATRLR